MFSGKLFTPRGLSGLDRLIAKELRWKVGVAMSATHEFSGVESLTNLSRLRLAQSAWVPVLNVEGCADLTAVSTALSTIDFFDSIPSLQSVGPRVSVSADNDLFRTKKEKIFSALKAALPSRLHANEFSLNINHSNILSLQTNLIPPRGWIRTPVQRNGGLEQLWSVVPLDSPKLCESAIKAFRNETSLACLSAALVESSNLKSILKTEEDLLIWDPFVGNGSVVLEVLAFLTENAQRPVTIVGNVGSRASADSVVGCVREFAASLNLPLLEETGEAESGSNSKGRKSRRTTTPDPTDNERRVQTVTLGSTTIHLTIAPFQETFPFISGAVILTHIPKTYSEQLGIDKRTLTDWTAFGALLKANRNFQMFVLAETGSFFKYSKLKLSKLTHLVSPNGSAVGSISKWVGI